MSIEQECREKWRAFADCAKAAQSAGYVVSLPKSIEEGVGLSSTAQVQEPPAPAPIPEPIPEIEPEETLEIPTFRRSKKKDA